MPASRQDQGMSPGLAVLTSMITPAVLIPACSALILSTSVRLGRVVEMDFPGSSGDTTPRRRSSSSSTRAARGSPPAARLRRK
jgi:hypothetical protein